jgi:ribosome biogenesis GTPase
MSYLVTSFKGKFFHLLNLEDQTTVKAELSGKCKRKWGQALVGDHVEVTLTEDIAVIEEIAERRNEITRPRIANIDQLIFVFATILPEFSFLLLDKLILLANYYHIPFSLVITKIDKVDAPFLQQLQDDLAEYQKTLSFPIYYLNNKQFPLALKKTFHDLFAQKISIVTGQSGVGKSTLLNNLDPELLIKTNIVSHALQHGKHTTTSTQLYPFSEGWVADSPGFSNFEVDFLTPEDILGCYPDFFLETPCRFNGCTHRKEPQCAVKDQVEAGLISRKRYENYLKILSDALNNVSY